MMKYVVNKDKQTVMAFLEGTQMDAVKMIAKKLMRTGVPVDYYSNKLLMANKYSGTVTLRHGDTWNEEEGKRLAKEKCLANYHRGLEKRINKFYYDMAVAMSVLNKNSSGKECCPCECCNDCDHE